jgi:uncharacterized membrane protein YecN with MAPEG domain
MTVAIICTGLLGLLLFGLGFAVSLTRGSAKQVIGYPTEPNDKLHKIVRAHGNTAEYAPLLAILMLVSAQLEPATWVLWVMGVGTLARYLIAVGLMIGSLDKANPARFLGAFLTYVCGLALTANVLLSA